MEQQMCVPDSLIHPLPSSQTLNPHSNQNLITTTTTTLKAKMMKSESTKVDMPESSSVSKSKGAVMAAPREAKGGYKRGIAIFDFVLRICALVAVIAAAATMGTSDESLPFFTQFFQFQASYDDLPTFQFFLIAMALVGGYILLSLPFSIVSIVCPHAVGPRFFLFIMDIVALTLATAAGAAAAAIVYLAHNGNSNTNWIAICQQYGDFCLKISGAVVAGFISVVLLAILVVLAGFALRRH